MPSRDVTRMYKRANFFHRAKNNYFSRIVILSRCDYVQSSLFLPLKTQGSAMCRCVCANPESIDYLPEVDLEVCNKFIRELLFFIEEISRERSSVSV